MGRGTLGGGGNEAKPETLAHVGVDQVEVGEGGLQAAHLSLGGLDAPVQQVPLPLQLLPLLGRLDLVVRLHNI